ncbi:MAG: hypothetical protein FGF53_01895 [Candidatus Brockarchaeota archaeon]|nr:hypothetical protein [Candidatus Brockarchaeota archaeon]MBO3808639.1 hypothetical protein [Candidatus Brockarchaeota archaeon]
MLGAAKAKTDAFAILLVVPQVLAETGTKASARLKMFRKEVAVEELH